MIPFRWRVALDRLAADARQVGADREEVARIRRDAAVWLRKLAADARARERASVVFMVDFEADGRLCVHGWELDLDLGSGEWALVH